MSTETKSSLNFIEQIIEEHNANGKFEKRVHTRFPPEPNGYLHIGHAKAIYTNFSIAQKYGGKTNLRFDDTNPTTEDTEYVNGIQRDIQWLGFQWEGEALYASDYFGQLYDYAVELIKQGKAYVDDSTVEEIRAMRGTPTEPAQASQYRERSIAENLELFEGMKAGKYEEGSRVLRAKIDLSSPNMHMRDPILYRILNAPHHRTGDAWCIYPMYDWAHGLSDSIEGITHSLCSLEFEVHRPLYDWILIQLGTYRPQQIEFARLNVNYTITSKRKLRKLVEENYVSGWDDPRMPTITGMRRRGYTPKGIRNFIHKVGLARRENIIDISLLEHSVREDLNKVANRVMVVLDPLKLVITNYPEGQIEQMTAINNPEDPEAGSREMPFGRELYIERADFMENPPRKFYRLGIGRKVRLKHGYIVECTNVVKDENGEPIEVHCTYFPDSKSGSDTSGIKAKGTLHWVELNAAKSIEVRLYDRLFLDENPTGHKDKDFLEFVNPDSLQTISSKAEPSLVNAKVGQYFQFLRKGYYVLDSDSTEDQLIFNRTVTLKDGWKKK